MSVQNINTALCPYDRLDSSTGKALLKQIRIRLQQEDSCTLLDFVIADVLQKMLAEASRITHLAYPGPFES